MSGYKCLNCQYYCFDRWEDRWACKKSKYITPTLKDDLCKAWKGPISAEKREALEKERLKKESFIFPTAEDRKLTF